MSGITVSTAWTVYTPTGPHVYFQILPNTGYTLTVTNYYAWTRESASGPTLARLAYSLDGGATWVSDMDHAQSGCTGSGCCGSYMNLMNWLGGTGPSLTGITSTNGIIVAIYPFAPALSSGTFQVQYMEVDGTVNTASTPPTITTNPTNSTICSGANTIFAASATGTPTPTYQWQRSTTGVGGPWVNITTGMDGGIYGASFTTPTLTITGATIVENGYAYQMVATNSAGSATSTPALLTVLGVPVVSAITGTTSLCTTGSTTLADVTTGGAWSSASTGVATVNSSGIVSGVAMGTSVISYIVTNTCGSTFVTDLVTVVPPAAPILGVAPICIGSTTTVTNTTIGGTWTSSTPSVATVGSTTGVVTGIAQGTATITYSVTNACGTTSATTVVTVNAPAAAISGTTGICIGSTSTLTNTTIGGTWSSNNTAVATVGATNGVVSPVANGTSIITYSVTNACGTTATTTTVTVNVAAGAITGVSSICAGSITTLADPTLGGTWTSSTPGVATIGSSTGIVNGLAQGTSNITYSVTNSCGTTTAVFPMTVNTNAAPITGVTGICIGSTSTLSNTTTGGTWSSSNTAVATVGATNGVVSPVANGIATITYSVANACGTSAATTTVTINVAAGAITGTTNICVGATNTLTDATPGGTWVSTNPAIATINPSNGVVTGISQGSTTITYIVTNPCGTTTATFPVYVNRNAAVISGPDTVCVGSAAIYTDSTLSGVWTIANNNATIAATGMLTGVVQGYDTITYAVTNICGASSASKVVYIQAVPNPGVISGNTNVCSGSTITLSETTVGGTWSCSSTSASISASGVVSGVFAGYDSIFYSKTNGCGTSKAGFAVLVDPAVTPVVSIAALPSLSLCPNISVTFNPTTVFGGTIPVYHWYVNGVLSGTTSSFTYMPTNADVVKCELISNAACALPDSVSASATMTVSAPVIPAVSFTSSGGDTLCDGIPNIFTAIPVNGGATPSYNWRVNWISVATSNTFTYTPTNGDIVECTLFSSGACVFPDTAATTKIIAVLPNHTPEVLLSANPGAAICQGNDATLIATPVNGGYAPTFSWVKNGQPFQTGASFTYRPATGDSLTCTMVSNYHCSVPTNIATATIALSVNPVIIVTVTSSQGVLLTIGTVDTLTAHVTYGGDNPSYQWYKNGIMIPGATNYKLVRNDFRDRDSLTCVVTTGSGTPCEGIKGYNWAILAVAPLGVNNMGIIDGNWNIAPNPNEGEFELSGRVAAELDAVHISIMNVMGQLVYSRSSLVNNGAVAEKIAIGKELPAGNYILEVGTLGGRLFIGKVVLAR